MRDNKLYLNDIKEATEKIELFVKGLDFEGFSKDQKTVDAVVRNLEIIGEASRRLSEKIKRKYNKIDWKAIAGMRNIITHEYFSVNLEIIWKTVRERLPELKNEIEKIIEKE